MLVKSLAAMIACTFVLGLGATVMAGIHFDRLMRVFFSEHRTEWERCGHPFGMFWVPRDAKTERSGMSRTTLFTNWTFNTPVWAMQNQQSLLEHRQFKRFAIAGWILFGAFFVEMVTLIVVIFTGAAA